MTSRGLTKISGTWRQINKIHSRVSGSWREVRKAYVKVSGSWRLFHQYYRFLYDGITINLSTVSRGTTHIDGENLAYIGIVVSGDSSSRTYTGFTWDSVAGDWADGTQDNGDSEHKGAAIGLKNVGPYNGDYDYDKVFAATGLLNSSRHSIRMVGGRGLVSYVTHQKSAGQAYPQTFGYNALKDDVIVVIGNSRTEGTAVTNFSCTDMTLIAEPGTEHRVFYKQITADGYWSTSITNTNKYQQWCHIAVAFRPQKVVT